MEPLLREPQAKRRKVRKGTRSCWECKGRKVKCTYLTADEAVCDGCFRRGTKCVSQDLPEQPLAPVDRRRQIGNRMIRVESLIEKLVKTIGSGTKAAGVSDENINVTSLLDPESLSPSPSPIQAAQPSLVPSRSTPAWYVSTLSSGLPIVANGSQDAAGQDSFTRDTGSKIVVEQPQTSEVQALEKIAEALLNTFPSQEGVNMIVDKAGPMPSFYHQMVRKPYKEMRVDEKERQDQLAELTARHTPKTHPLIIARQMMLLAISFRYIHPAFHHELKGFSGPPRIVMQQVADAAIELITTNHGMVNTIEGLECLLLVSTFQADSGNLRDGWSNTRRALLTAQLMCLHRQNRPR